MEEQWSFGDRLGRMTRVLWLRPDKPDDVSVAQHRIASHLSSRGYDVVVRNVSFADFWHVLREPADVVVGTTHLGALVAGWRAVFRRTPTVIDHMDPVAQLRRNHGRLVVGAVALLESLVFRAADEVLVVYDEAVERVANATDTYTETSLGVDYDRFASPDPNAVDRARSRLDTEGIGHSSHDDSRILIYVGGLEPAYNVDVLVTAMAELPEWDLVVLGDGSQRDIVEDADLENVHYLGTVPHEEVPGYLAVADVGISLVDDPNTLKVLEYGAAGLPAVSVAGAAEDRFGELMEYCGLDPQDVASAVERANLRDNTDEFRSFTADFSWAAIVEEYEQAIERALD